MQSNQVTNDIFGIGYNVACVAGVRKGRGRELGRETTREGPRAPLAFLSRLKLPFQKLPFPSLSNACHAG